MSWNNWWDAPDWGQFTEQVRLVPDDDVRRTVAADWLDEQGDATAAARAALIRAGCKEGRGHSVKLAAHQFAAHGFPEPAYAGCAGLSVSRGWPEWAVFWPNRFAIDVVTPAFLAAPITTVSTVGVCANPVPHTGWTESGASVTRTRYQLFVGPEEHATGFAPGLTSPEHLRRYAVPGLIPAPVFFQMPKRRGAGGAVQRQWQLDRVDLYENLEECARTVLSAHWLAALQFVRDATGSKAKRIVVPAPHYDAVKCFFKRAKLLRDGEPVRSIVDDPDPFALIGPNPDCRRCSGKGYVTDTMYRQRLSGGPPVAVQGQTVSCPVCVASA